MIVDELREVVMEPSRVLRSKLADYVNSVWNKFDLFIVTFAVASVVLKNFRATFGVEEIFLLLLTTAWFIPICLQVARVLFAINCALFYMRIFRIYHASKNLGPKLVIFHRMVPTKRVSQRVKRRQSTIACLSLDPRDHHVRVPPVCVHPCVRRG